MAQNENVVIVATDSADNWWIRTLAQHDYDVMEAAAYKYANCFCDWYLWIQTLYNRLSFNCLIELNNIAMICSHPRQHWKQINILSNLACCTYGYRLIARPALLLLFPCNVRSTIAPASAWVPWDDLSCLLVHKAIKKYFVFKNQSIFVTQSQYLFVTL